MQQRDMGVPRSPGVDPQAQRMVGRETEVVRAAGIDEREPAAGIRVPGVGRDLVERGLQLRGVNHERQIYGALAGWQLPTGCRRPRNQVSAVPTHSRGPAIAFVITTRSFWRLHAATFG